MAGGKREAGRELADLCAAYGAGVLTALGRPLDYLTYCQLLLNVDRVRLADAVAVARGVGIARGDADVPLAYFDAIAASRREAEDMEFSTNADRAFARVRGGHGR